MLDDGPVKTDDRTTTVDVLITKVDDLTGAIDKLISSNGNHGNTITVTHRNEGMNAWGVAAVTACFCTMIMLLGALLVGGLLIQQLRSDLTDQESHRTVHERRITKLEAERKP